MKKYIISFIILAILLLIPSSNSYSKGDMCSIDELRNIYSIIDMIPFSRRDYVLNKFDCSNMSHYVRDLYAKFGYEAKIIVIFKPKTSHAIVKVRCGMSWVFIEATYPRVILLFSDMYVGTWKEYSDAEDMKPLYNDDVFWNLEWGYDGWSLDCLNKYACNKGR